MDDINQARECNWMVKKGYSIIQDNFERIGSNIGNNLQRSGYENEIINTSFDMKKYKHDIKNNVQQTSVKCNDCESSFKNKIALKNHLDQVHFKKLESFKNSNVSTDNIIMHKRHVRKVINDKNNFQEDIFEENEEIKNTEKNCDSKKDENSLEKNTQKKSKNATFETNKSALIENINLVSLKLKKFSCKYCKLTFGKKPELQRHMNEVHLNLKPFSCEVCEKSRLKFYFLLGITRFVGTS